MFFAILSSLVFCQSTKVIQLDSPSFRDLVLKREDTDMWVVLFIGHNEKKCHKAEHQFEKASEMSGEIAKFGIVNISTDPFVGARMKLEFIPAMYIFYSGGQELYRGQLKADAIVNAISDKMPSFVRTFDRKWLEESIPSVVLFTDQIKVPTLWATLSLKYREQFIRFGMCSEFHIHKEFSIARLPTVMFFNSTSQVRYRGELTETDIKQSIDSFLNGTLSVEDVIDDEGFYRFSEFEDQCRGRDFCVLYTGKKISEEYRNLRIVCRRHPMKFFYGQEAIPFKGMKKDNYYIWNPRREGIISIDSIESLTGAVDRVIDGGAKWTKLNVFNGDDL